MKLDKKYLALQVCMGLIALLVCYSSYFYGPQIHKLIQGHETMTSLMIYSPLMFWALWDMVRTPDYAKTHDSIQRLNSLNYKMDQDAALMSRVITNKHLNQIAALQRAQAQLDEVELQEVVLALEKEVQRLKEEYYSGKKAS